MRKLKIIQGSNSKGKFYKLQIKGCKRHYYKTEKGHKRVLKLILNDLSRFEGIYGGSVISEIGRHIRGIINSISGPRMNLKPNVREVLAEYGNEPIINMWVSRTPIVDTINKVLTLINKLSGTDEPHDKLFHLFLYIELENKKALRIEKNEDINMTPIILKPELLQDVRRLSIPSGLTLNLMIQNTIQNIGENDFFLYRAFSTNCQHWVYSMLISNGITVDESLKQFILQPVQDIAPTWGQKLVNFLTDLKNRLNQSVSGAGIHGDIVDWKNTPFNQLLSYVQNN